jgi:hypothetical protein
MGFNNGGVLEEERLKANNGVLMVGILVKQANNKRRSNF